MPMVANIFPDHRSRHVISHRADKIPVLPKLPFPQLLPQFGKFLKHPARRNTLQYPDNLGNRIPGREIQKDVDMVLGDLLFVKLKPKVFHNLTEHLVNPSPNIFSGNPFSIFGSPHQMIFRVVHRMAGPFNGHPFRISQPGPTAAAG